MLEEKPRNIVIIGCGDSERGRATLKAIELAEESVKGLQLPAVMFHDVNEDIGKDELRAIALDYKKKEIEVVLLDSMPPPMVRPDVETFKITAMPRLKEMYIPIEDNKGKQYPKKNWKNKRKRNKKR